MQPNESQSFQAGDVVRLRGGGPWMTVRTVDTQGVWCNWFAEAEVKKDVFKADMLARPKPPSPAGSRRVVRSRPLA